MNWNKRSWISAMTIWLWLALAPGNDSVAQENSRLGFVNITIASNPSGRQVTVDGAGYTAPIDLVWIAASTHEIATSSPQPVTSDSRYAWSHWSDGGPIVHQVTPTSNMTYTAFFKKQFLLSTVAGAGGVISPPTSWYDSSQVVMLTAIPDPGYQFDGWIGSGTGSYTGTDNPASVTTHGPITQTATFSQIPSIAITEPVGGEQWTAGGTALVSWTSINITGGVNIRLSTDGGTTFPHALVENIANDGTEVVAVPFLQSLSSRVKVEAASDQLIQGVSPANFSIIIPLVEVEIGTSPQGLEIIVDDTVRFAPASLTWQIGSVHSIAVDSVQGDTSSFSALNRTAGTRYVWTSWSDGGARQHLVSPAFDSVFTAYFGTQFLLTMNAGVGGSVAPLTGWHDSSVSVQISATPDAGYLFDGWVGSGMGSFTGSDNPASITMLDPISQTALFSPVPTITVAEPGAGAVWSAGSSGLVTWSSVNITGGVTIRLSIDGGATFPLVLSENTQNDGSELVPVPFLESTACRVSVESALNPATLGINPGNFSIVIPLVSVQLRTMPEGREIIVDDTTYVAPQVFSWLMGSMHTISVDSIQGDTTSRPFNAGAAAIEPGTRYRWTVWSDGGLRSHLVAPSSDTLFTASFLTEYRLTMDGTHPYPWLLPASGWYERDTTLEILSTHPGGTFPQYFVGWVGLGSGSYSGPQNPSFIQMLGQIAETATWANCTYTADPPQLAFGWQGGNGAFSVQTEAPCPWNAVASVGWLRVDSSRSHVGGDSVWFSVDENPDTVARSGLILVVVSEDTSAAFVVQQEGLPSVGIRQVQVVEGWNIVSLPLVVVDPRPHVVFPTSSSPAFSYDGSVGYSESDTLRMGRGYWIKFDYMQVIELSGTVVLTDTVDLTVNWNLVGAGTLPIDVASIETIPPGIITSAFYGFAGGYVPVPQLQPGQGYWVKVSSPGKLVLSVLSR